MFIFLKFSKNGMLQFTENELVLTSNVKKRKKKKKKSAFCKVFVSLLSMEASENTYPLRKGNVTGLRISL